MQKSKLVKIISVGYPSYWYADLIGKVFEVVDYEYDREEYLVTADENNREQRLIQKSDTEELSGEALILHKLEKARQEAIAAQVALNGATEKVRVLEKELTDLHMVKLVDIVEGAKFTIHGGDDFVVLIKKSNGDFLLGGLGGKDYRLYSDEPRSRLQMHDHLRHLIAKKVTK